MHHKLHDDTAVTFWKYDLQILQEVHQSRLYGHTDFGGNMTHNDCFRHLASLLFQITRMPFHKYPQS